MRMIMSVVFHLQFTLKYTVIHYAFTTSCFKCLSLLELFVKQFVLNFSQKQLQYMSSDSIGYVLWNICDALFKMAMHHV
jgi:hypothetical protein